MTLIQITLMGESSPHPYPPHLLSHSTLLAAPLSYSPFVLLLSSSSPFFQITSSVSLSVSLFLISIFSLNLSVSSPHSTSRLVSGRQTLTATSELLIHLCFRVAALLIRLSTNYSSPTITLLWSLSYERSHLITSDSVIYVQTPELFGKAL